MTILHFQPARPPASVDAIVRLPYSRVQWSCRVLVQTSRSVQVYHPNAYVVFVVQTGSVAVELDRA